jgi:hypothetical protein
VATALSPSSKQLKTPVILLSCLSVCLHVIVLLIQIPRTLENLSLSLSLTYLAVYCLVYSSLLVSCALSLTEPSSTTKQAKLILPFKPLSFTCISLSITLSPLFPRNAQLLLFNTAVYTNPTNASPLLVNFGFLKWVCSSFRGCFAGFFLFSVSEHTVITQRSPWSSWRPPLHSRISTHPHLSLKFSCLGMAPLAQTVLSVVRYAEL